MRIKLIVSDIDGTLIPYGESGLPEALFPLVRALREADILFCPASGRQYHSLRCLFAPVADEIAYLCENGAIVMGSGGEQEARLLSKTVMPRDEALALARAILMQPRCEVLISGANVSYLCPKDSSFVELFRGATGNHIRVEERIEDIAEDIVKISAYAPGGLDGPKAALGPCFGRLFRMDEAGPAWLDFTVADKGTGLRGLCAALGVTPSETAAFGDNWNDVTMLETAGRPYIMSTASRELRGRFPGQCDDVLTEIRRILDENKGKRP